MSLKTRLKNLLIKKRSHSEMYPHRKDVVRYELQPHAYLEVFWKVLEIGRGPSVALFVYDQEVVKFDCFGAKDGHYHINERQWGKLSKGTVHRLYFPEQTVEAQIERAVFELRTNLSVYLQRNADPRVRNCRIDPACLAEMTGRMREKMLEYLRTIPALQPHHSPRP